MFTFSLPHPVYTEKAKSIIAATLGYVYSQDMASDYAAVFRDERGEVKLFSWHGSLRTQDLVRNLADLLLSRSRNYNAVRNTMAARAADKHECTFLGYSKRDMSCLGYVLKGASMKLIRRYFGDECVDSLVGQPVNPLQTVKRRAIIMRAEALFEEMKAKRQEIHDSFPLLNSMNGQVYDAMSPEERRKHDAAYSKRSKLVRANTEEYARRVQETLFELSQLP